MNPDDIQRLSDRASNLAYGYRLYGDTSRARDWNNASIHLARAAQAMRAALSKESSI